MHIVADRSAAPATIHTDLGALFVPLELSKIDLADHFAVAGQWREDVETCGARR